MILPHPFCVDPALHTTRRFMEETIPYNRFLGVRCLHLVPGECVLEVPWRDELIGDPGRPAVHGGVISMMLDTAGGAAVFSRFDSPADRCSTVDLRVDYLRPGPKDALRCYAQVVRLGNRVAVTRMNLYGASTPEKIVATGQAVYNIVWGSDEGR